MKNARRSYAVISDIHLGARTTPATEILAHLTAFFDDFKATSAFSKIDVLFIAGDLFDDTLEFSSEVFSHFLPWFHRLLRFCALYKVKLRILEGTPRHDRKQATTLVKIVEMLAVDVDFKYIGDIGVETFDDLDLTVLYVPDESRHTAAATEEAVDNVLLDAGRTGVDIAIMHGMFKYQLGTIPMNSKVHDEAWYLARVKHYINIGHVHISSQSGRILAQGSFDRLRHGEEGPKGGMLIQETDTGEWIHFFIENPLAKIYTTVEVTGSVEKALATIHKAIKALPMDSHVRIQAAATHPIFQGFETLRQKYPGFIFTKKAVAESEVRVETGSVIYTPIVLNRDTLTEAICQEIANQHDIDVAEYHELRQLLETLHD